MKRTTKEIKIVTTLVILAVLFLLSFNVVYSYFTAMRDVNAKLSFYDLEIQLTYVETLGGQTSTIENQKQLFPAKALSRNVAVGLKASEQASSVIYNLGVKSTSESCDAYVRFYLEVYMVKQFSNGVVGYVDSKGNYVTEDGKYLNESGTEISATGLDVGSVVDYAQYFELGYLNGNAYSYSANITRQTNTIGEKNYVAYFYNSKLENSSSRYIGINSIKMLNSAPNELLDSDVIIYITMEGVQATNGAYKHVFNDNYGYYNWES